MTDDNGTNDMGDPGEGMVDEIVGEFLVESHEALDQLDQDLVSLEDDATPETLASIFRTMHTIKGTCGFLGFGHLETLAHAAENLLSPLRDGTLEVTADITTALLAAVDAVRDILAVIERTGSDGDSSYPDLVDELTRLQDPDASAAAPKPGPRVGDLLMEKAGVRPEDVDLAISEQALGDSRPLGEILVDHGVVGADEVAEALTNQSEHKSSVADSTIRVDVRLLDDLMNLVGELVLARNQIIQLSLGEDTEALTVPAQRLNHITTELQEGVMRTRMQPIGNVWNKFPRVVRDLSRACGKRIEIEMDGAGTELDKTIVEAIKDPLTHLVRNSVDHGIEDPDARVAAGKAADGRLILRAFHEGGQVVIEISDDGAGIDVTKVGAKAVERGLVTREALDSMSQRELVNLIFLPGFSTAEVVTNVSGRGVGMDVVKTNIERIGGTLDVTTEHGVGSTFRIKIPLTLAIIPALMVGCGGERFAIPQVSLLELVRIDGERVRTEIEWIHGAPVYRLRGRLLPVVDLAGELDFDALPLAERAAVNMVVLQADGRRFGLVVDQITDTQEIVVKPLASQVNDAGVFAGATVLGDGRVSLILDVLGIAQRSRVLAEGSEQLVDQGDVDGGPAADRDTVLVVDLGEGQRAAVALSTVARLEQLPRSTIESSSRGPVIQYRGDLLPLVHLATASGIGHPLPITAADEGLLDVVVWSGAEGQVGLVVDRIIDIVEENLTASASPSTGGSSAAFVAVVAGKVTDVIDVGALLGARSSTDPARALSPVFG